MYSTSFNLSLHHSRTHLPHASHFLAHTLFTHCPLLSASHSPFTVSPSLSLHFSLTHTSHFPSSSSPLTHLPLASPSPACVPSQTSPVFLLDFHVGNFFLLFICDFHSPPSPHSFLITSFTQSSTLILAPAHPHFLLSHHMATTGQICAEQFGSTYCCDLMLANSRTTGQAPPLSLSPPPSSYTQAR